MRDYPVGKAQQMVLDALELTATGHGDAQRVFRSHGMTVASNRVGRKSLPVITLLETQAGGMHNDDGWTETVEFEKANLEKVSQWIEG